MANLSLAIPHDKWDFVISEVRRVLKVGGLLEIIDDEVLFPYGAFPIRVAPSGHHQRSGRVSHDPCYPRVISDGEGSDTDSSTYSGDDDKEFERTLKGEGMNRRRPGSLWAANVDSRRYPMSYFQQWTNNYQIARGVEDSFVGMLQQRSIHLTPQELVHRLRHAFGYKNCSNPQTYDITLAPVFTPETIQPEKTKIDDLLWSDTHLLDSPEEMEWGYSSGSDGDSPVLPTPPQHSAKAAGRLGISYSTLVAATATTATVRRQHQAPRRSLQSPGIIVSPSTFIALTPIETEFHACKWIHTVLGCKPAIADYVRSDDGQIGRKEMDEAELEDALWNYEK